MSAFTTCSNLLSIFFLFSCSTSDNSCNSAGNDLTSRHYYCCDCLVQQQSNKSSFVGHCWKNDIHRPGWNCHHWVWLLVSSTSYIISEEEEEMMNQCMVAAFIIYSSHFLLVFLLLVALVNLLLNLLLLLIQEVVKEQVRIWFLITTVIAMPCSIILSFICWILLKTWYSYRHESWYCHHWW